jgi:SAM-dependent methyltransferase
MNPEKSCNPFQFYNPYYDLLYQNKNYKEEAAYISKIIHQLAPAAKDILELGSGTGNYSSHFCDAGYKVTGIERCQLMMEASISKVINGFDAVNADIRTFELDRKYEVVISLFHVISYLTHNNDIISCLGKVSEHIKPNGIFIFDVWYTPAVYSLGPEKRTRKIEDDNFEITRIAEPVISYNANTVEVHYHMHVNNKQADQVAEFKEVHVMRHFSTPEIELFASITGFKLLQSEEFLTGKQPSADTWGVCYILQKNG